MKKFVLAVLMCLAFSAVSNAIWLPAFFLRFVNAEDKWYETCTAYCQACIWGKGGGGSGACLRR
ncbi:MAG: hypothetical protein LBH33_05920 [Endomicrobium sp.]|jgi:hypothetical protein|nr:hypothetical protein [Endomicrobium sp.]